MGRPREQRILRRMPVRQPAVAFLEVHMVGSKLRDEDDGGEEEDNDDDDGEVE